MASKAFLIAVVIAAAIAAPALATEYMVGDDAGWKLGVNYTQWAQGKHFRVGDKIMFKYDAAYNNVAKVNASDFQQCISNSIKVQNAASDTITLATPGKKWYICSVNDHCSKGMKLVINVDAAEGPAPSPTPGTSAATTEVSPVKSYLWVLATLAAIKLNMA